MTQKEFEERAIPVETDEFKSIDAMYMACDVDKDKFCELWCKMNYKRVSQYKGVQKREYLRDTYYSLIYQKSCYPGFEYRLIKDVLSTRKLQKLQEYGIGLEDYDGPSYYGPYKVKNVLFQLKSTLHIYR